MALYKSVEYNGKEYKSLKDLWIDMCSPGISYGKFIKRIYQNNWSIDDALHIESKSREINYNGKVYKTKKELWKQECTCGISYGKFIARIDRSGWSIDEALHKPIKIPPNSIEYNGKEYKNKYELYRSECTCGITYDTFIYRLDTGYTIDDALHKNEWQISYNGKVYKTKKELWKQECTCGISYGIFNNRIRIGLSIDEALHKPIKNSPKSIEYNGKVYKNLKELWECESFSETPYSRFLRTFNKGFSLTVSLGISPILSHRIINFTKNNTRFDLTIMKRIKKGTDVFECVIENFDDGKKFKIMSYDMIDQYCLQKYNEERGIG